jgi:tyrosyl-tRNA synthetase
LLNVCPKVFFYRGRTEWLKIMFWWSIESEGETMTAHSHSNLAEAIMRAPDEAVSLDTILRRGVDTIMPEQGLRELLESGPQALYLGIDPTAPDLHVGHMVPLRKLRQFQELGHHVILLFGTFTGMIGDPSDKSSTRKRLTPAQVESNVSTYRQQAGQILDLSESAANPVTVVYNHDWLEKLGFADVVELAAQFTVNQFVARETYRLRLEAGTPLFLHEFLYPLMQGYDSVALSDEFGLRIEVGGKDQIPNMMSGRDMLGALRGVSKYVLGTKLIEDPSGIKMGKSLGNVVNLTDLPEVAFEGLMSWTDGQVAPALEMLTALPMELVERVDAEMKLIAEGGSDENPMTLKEAFAFRIVSQIHGEEEANQAQGIFDLVKRQKQLPPRMREVEVQSGTTLVEALVASGLAKTAEEAQSKLTQQAVRLDGEQIRKNVTLSGTNVVELGKQSIKNVRRIIVS